MKCLESLITLHMPFFQLPPSSHTSYQRHGRNSEMPTQGPPLINFVKSLPKPRAKETSFSL